MTWHPAIRIDPALMGGQPCIAGSRLTREHAATNIAARGIDDYYTSYEVDPSRRRDVLVACAWWTLNSTRGPKWHRVIRNAWRDWAVDVWAEAWHHDAELPDPPTIEREVPA